MLTPDFKKSIKIAFNEELKKQSNKLIKITSDGSYIYFIRSKDAIKIGRTKYIENRLKVLQTSSPYRLEVMKVIYGSKRIEDAIHKKFEKIRLEGE